MRSARAVALACATLGCACSLLTNTDELNSYVDSDAAPGDSTLDSVRDAAGEAAEATTEGGGADTTVPATDYAALVKADGPLAYWRLAETSGSTAKDEMGAFDGTWIGSPELGVAGPFGRAARFEGAERVVADALANRGVAWPGLTMEVWFASELAPSAEGDFVQFADPNGYTRISMFRDDATNAPKAHVGDSFYPTAKTIVTDAEWHHLVVTMGNDVISLYVDAKLEATLAGSTTVPTTGLFAIGADYDESPDGGPFAIDGYFVGRIAEVAIYDEALSAARIAAHFAARR